MGNLCVDDNTIYEIDTECIIAKYKNKEIKIESNELRKNNEENNFVSACDEDICI